MAEQVGMHQTCKVCGHRDKFDFHVPDDVWEAVVPPDYQGRVVCLSCFDEFAYQHRVNYAASLHTLYFVGSRATFVFRATRRLGHA